MEAGHEFLLRMGKTRLRPGGIEATNWLLNSVDITPETQILEVACNIGTTTVELVKRFHCHVTAIDLNADVLPKTKENREKQHRAVCNGGTRRRYEPLLP